MKLNIFVPCAHTYFHLTLTPSYLSYYILSFIKPLQGIIEYEVLIIFTLEILTALQTLYITTIKCIK